MSYLKKPEDRCAHASISMPKPHWAALDVMRGLTPRATYLADIVKRRWHAHLDEHPELVELYRRENPALLIGYAPSSKSVRPSSRSTAPQHAFAAETPAAYVARKKSAA